MKNFYTLLFAWVLLSTSLCAQITSVHPELNKVKNLVTQQSKGTTVIELTLTNFQNGQIVNVNVPYGNNLQIVQDYGCVTGSVGILSSTYTSLGFLPYTSAPLTSGTWYACVWGSLAVQVVVTIQTTGIDDTEELHENCFSVYPSVTTDFLYIKSSYESSYEIYDLSGKLVVKTDARTINVSDFKPGIYFIKDIHSVKKFFKE